MNRLIQESRDVFRSLLRSRRFFVLASGCLALGLGANAVMFGVVDAYFLRAPALVRDPDQIVRLYFDRYSRVTGRGLSDLASYLVLTDIRDAVPNATTAASYLTFVSEGSGASAAKLRAALVTQEYLGLLGVAPAIGRSFQAEDAHVGADPVAILSDHVWRSRFSARPRALGEHLLIAGRRFSIIGVMPREFIGIELEPVDVWLPLEVAASDLIGQGYTTRRGAWAISLLARLGPGVSQASFEAAATQAYRTGLSQIVRVESWDRVVTGPLVRERGPRASDQARVSAWLGGLSVAVLIIACLNTAALMAVRALRRQPEFAVRMALGASPVRLLRVLIMEALGISLVSAVAAVAIAGLATGALRGLLLPQNAPLTLVSYARVFGFTLLLGLGVGLGVSVPLSRIVTGDFMKLLRVAPAGRMLSRSPARFMALVGQIALTMAVLTAAGLFARSLLNARALDLGFEPDGVLAINIDFAGMAARGRRDKPPDELYRRLEDAVRTVPGVTSASVATGMPFQYMTGGLVSIPGRDSTTLPKLPVAMINASEGHLRTLGLRLRAGRWFGLGDYGSGAGSAVINETMAKIFWPGASPLGQCIVTIGEPHCRYVVGIVADTRRSNLHEQPIAQLYMPEARNPALMSHVPRTLLVKSSKPGAVKSAVRHAVHSVDATLAYVSVQEVNELIAPKLLPWRLGARMLAAFGALALLLTALGLYGNVNWMVAERAHELGVRLALGASRAHILRVTLTRTLLVVAVGVGLGSGMVFLGAGYLEPLLFDVSPRAVGFLAAATTVVGLVSLAACYSPLRRATRLDPLEVLRSI